MESMLSIFSPRILDRYQKCSLRDRKPLPGMFEVCIEQHMDYATQSTDAHSDEEALQVGKWHDATSTIFGYDRIDEMDIDLQTNALKKRVGNPGLWMRGTTLFGDQTALSKPLCLLSLVSAFQISRSQRKSRCGIAFHRLIFPPA